MNIVWFKRDLRVEDHAPLMRASQRGPVLPLYVVEPEFWALPDASARHWQFVSESLVELRQELYSMGQPLVVRIGQITDILSSLKATHGDIHLWSHEETGNAWTFERDLRVADWAKRSGTNWTEIQGEGVIRRLKSRNGWAKKWDSAMAQPMIDTPRSLSPVSDIEVGSLPDAKALGLKPDLCNHRQVGGRSKGLDTLYSFLHERGRTYRKDMSSPVSGAEACSRLSPYLAWGTLSLREVTQATRERQRELKALDTRDGWRGSMSSFVGRLHWRNHFMQKLEDEPKIEFENFHSAYNGLRPLEPDVSRLRAWSAGETGLPFVDACMRFLQASGWLNFRMRAMLAAVSSYHLWLDWRKPGEHLARLFTDYEPGIHWSQMQMQSGTTGINTVRVYNPVKQGYDQDTGGHFTRKWVPELKDIPDEFTHEPWKAPNASSVLGKIYPFPIIDHMDAARMARQKVWAIRKDKAYRSSASKIQSKHGSRKSGIRNRGKSARKTTTSNQLSLSFMDQEK